MTDPVLKIGIQELKDLATAVAHTAGGIDGVFADGVVDWKDAPRIPSLLKALGEFREVNFADVIPQASDVDAAEHAELAAHFNVVFNLNEDGIEATVEAGFEIMLSGLEALQSLREIAAAIRDRFIIKSAPA